jgi:hypothetical protein
VIVELRARKRIRPRRAVIIHEWVTHDWVNLVFGPTPDVIFVANTFIDMRWPRGPEAWTMERCVVCNREFLWDRERYEKRPSCPYCAEEIDSDFE